MKHGDGRLRERYIERAYPHTPAAATAYSRRRERQVASALRNCFDFEIASLTCGAEGSTHRVYARSCSRPAKGPR